MGEEVGRVVGVADEGGEVLAGVVRAGGGLGAADGEAAGLRAEVDVGDVGAGGGEAEAVAELRHVAELRLRHGEGGEEGEGLEEHFGGVVVVGEVVEVLVLVVL